MKAPVAGRTCGTCTLCCKLLRIPELDKPQGTWCPPYYSQLKTWATQGITAQRQVVVRIGSRTIAVLPDRDVDLGQMQPGERVAIEGRVTPLGMVYDAYRAK